MVDQIPQAVTPQQPPQQMPWAPLQVAPVQQTPQQNIQAAVRPQQTPNITKPTSKVSLKGILIGCWVLFMFVVWWLALVFYNLINNPTQLASVGLDPNTTKTFLQIFSVVFFGILTFVGIGLLIVNLYRIVTIKNRSRIRYIVWAFAWFFLFILAIALGASVITKVRALSVENIIDNDKLIMPYLQLKDKVIYTRNDEKLKLIAPATMRYALNGNYFNAQILPQLGQVSFSSIVLDCGNGQKIAMNIETAQFEQSCMYFNKGEYPLNLETTYINLLTSEKLQQTFPAWSIVFETEIRVAPTKGELMFNDANTEMILGQTPAKALFDASEVFSDLALNEYKMVRDLNGDGEQDKPNTISTTFVYNQAKLYNIYIRFPELNDYIYTFPVRVEPSDVPVCEILVDKTEGKAYAISTNFFEKNVNIVEYQFDIIDRNNKDKPIYTTKNKNGTFNYQFQDAWVYAVQTTFLTEDDKQGQCESDDVQVGVSDFQINYDMYYKTSQSPQFQKITATWAASLNNGTITLTQIPSIIKLQINQLSPNPTTVSKTVTIDGKKVISADGKNFEITIEDSQNHEMILLVADKPSGAETKIILPIQIDREEVVGKLIVTPSTVGNDPFSVTFDASTSVLNDPEDEIVSFTRDFGDGTPIKKNFSESIITHTYRYDTANENGTFHPIITIKTKKWREVSVSPSTDIVVKRSLETLDIAIDSHPAQIAKVGDRVQFSIEFNGLSTEIQRDFGDKKTLSCKTRQECSSTSNIYMTPGTYTVRASVAYENQPTIEGSITIKITQ